MDEFKIPFQRMSWLKLMKNVDWSPVPAAKKKASKNL